MMIIKARDGEINVETKESKRAQFIVQYQYRCQTLFEVSDIYPINQPDKEWAWDCH
jgi:hypothetical protein